MRQIIRHHFHWIFILSSCTLGLNIIPDSISKSVAPMSYYGLPLETIKLKNQSNTVIAVDSILIRFQNGDSSDFRMGFDCQPTQFYDYNYKGWVYGSFNKTLRYLRDSLFLLQDSVGNIITISIAPNDSADFIVYLVVNCPICGRMPSFPKTTRYLYLFHSSSGKSDSLKVYIDDKTFIEKTRMPNRTRFKQNENTKKYDFAGRMVHASARHSYGIII
jgi:hypothetical protein